MDERPEAQVHLDDTITEFREMKMQPAPSTVLRASLERAPRHKGLLTA